jgi:hypothetical protein
MARIHRPTAAPAAPFEPCKGGPCRAYRPAERVLVMRVQAGLPCSCWFLVADADGYHLSPGPWDRETTPHIASEGFRLPPLRWMDGADRLAYSALERRDVAQLERMASSAARAVRIALGWAAYSELWSLQLAAAHAADAWRIARRLAWIADQVAAWEVACPASIADAFKVSFRQAWAEGAFSVERCALGQLRVLHRYRSEGPIPEGRALQFLPCGEGCDVRP